MQFEILSLISGPYHFQNKQPYLLVYGREVDSGELKHEEISFPTFDDAYYFGLRIQEEEDNIVLDFKECLNDNTPHNP